MLDLPRNVLTVEVMIPTCNRLSSLIMTLTGVLGQTALPGTKVTISDQSDPSILQEPVLVALIRMLEAHGASVETIHHMPRRGIAEHRDFLLSRAQADAVLFLDDDVYMDPWLLAHLRDTMQAQRCGFVGSFPHGLSYRGDVRPTQQHVEFWDGPVQPEDVEPESAAWERFHLHRAANLFHVQSRLAPGERRRYKVAWIAACVLYDRRKSLEVGGFSFWSRLPHYQSGEEVVLQNLLMRRWGGCAVMPSGAWFSELPSTVLNEQGTIDQHALTLLPDLIARISNGAPETVR